MNLDLKKPLAVFDIEATGTDIIEDRIVEIAVVKAHPNGDVEEKQLLINPTVPIPKDSSLIHGIKDEDVKDAPTFKQVAKELWEFLKGCDLAGFSILKFDVPLLVEEFLRVDLDFDLKNKRIIDTQRIFHLMEKRNLAAALKFYCQQDLQNAHSAMADTQATYEVLKAQVERYKGQKVTDIRGNNLGVIENDMQSLSDITNSKWVDLAGRFAYNQENVEVFNFGKYRGRPILEVLAKEPQYYDWMMNGKFPRDTKRKLTEIKLRGFNS